MLKTETDTILLDNASQNKLGDNQQAANTLLQQRGNSKDSSH